MAPSRLLLVAACAVLLTAAPRSVDACPFAGSMRGEVVDGAGRKLLQANNCNINALVAAGPYNPPGPKTLTATVPGLLRVREIAYLALLKGGSGVPGIQAPGGSINKNVPFGALLRVPFHDCGTFNVKTKTGGCNGSLQREVGAAPNTGKNLVAAMALLKKYQALINARITADALYKSGVIPANTKISMADLMVLAGVVVVEVAGGPTKAQLYNKIEMGRVDLAVGKDDAQRLPKKNLNYQGVMCWYLNAGYTVLDTVAALGSHDIGFHKTNVGMSDSPDKWNGQYFTKVLAGKGAFPADTEIGSKTGLARVHVQKFATDKKAFNDAFTAFYLRMANMCNKWTH